MKKTLSIILAILMIVTTIPFAFAAEDDYVAAITIDGETTYYETFPDVRNLYRNTEITIDLLADVEYVFKCGYSIAKPWVINLNGHTMTAISNNGAILSMGYNAVVTLNGPGKLINAGTNTCTIYVDLGGFVIGGEEAPEISNEIRIRDITAGYITVNTPLSNAQYLISVNNKVASYPSKAFIFAGEGVDLSTDWFEPIKTNVCRKLTKTEDGICFSENVEHNKIQVDAKAPTCIENGWNAYEYCSDCKYTTYVNIPVNPDVHTPLEAVKENEVAPKCGVAGSYDLVVYCDDCGAELDRETKTVDALTHTFTKYEVIEEAKCGVAGKEVATCDNGCGETDEKAIEALTHTDADGDYKCDHGCGHEFEKPAPEEPTPDTPDEPTEDTICSDCGLPAHEETGVAMFICLLIGLFKLIYTMITNK